MPEEKTKIFYFDTSAFIRLNRFYPMHIFPDLWEELESLIKSGHLISHEYVFKEIFPKTKNPDFLGTWAKEKVSIFKKITLRQTEIVAEILAKFPGLIDYGKEKDEADPWVIAMALEALENSNLFPREIIVVSEESIKSSTKIPAVCKGFGVNHMNLFELFKVRGWIFKIKKL